MTRGLELLQKRKNIQDYVVAPKQLRLDGTASADGTVRQFVAMPLGQGYTVEAQITGEEVVGGLQFGITPSKIPRGSERLSKRLYPKPEGTKYFQVTIRNKDHGDETVLEVSPQHTVSDIKEMIYEAEGIHPSELRLLYDHEMIDSTWQPKRTLADVDIHGPCTLCSYITQVGGGGGPKPPSMGIGAGGLIRQSIIKDTYKPTIWEPDCGTIFNVQILNSARYTTVTGKDPYFRIFDEEPSGIEGNFEGVKPISAMDAEGIKTKEKAEALAEVAESTNYEVVLLDHEGKRVGFRPVSDMEKAVRAPFKDT
jgi:hypothetical protein